MKGKEGKEGKEGLSTWSGHCGRLPGPRASSLLLVVVVLFLFLLLDLAVVGGFAATTAPTPVSKALSLNFALLLVSFV